MSSASAGQEHQRSASLSYHNTYKVVFRITAAGLLLQSEHKCIFSQSLSGKTKLTWPGGKGIHTVMMKGGG